MSKTAGGAARRAFVVRSFAGVAGVAAAVAPVGEARAQRMGRANPGYGFSSGPRLRPNYARPVAITVEQPVAVQGPLPPPVVRRVVMRNTAQILHCVEQGMASEPGMNVNGLLRLRFAVSPAGVVMGVQTTAGPPAGWGSHGTNVAACVSASFRRWAFPSMESAPSMVTMTLRFRS